MTNGFGQDGHGLTIRLFVYSPSRSAKTARELLHAGITEGAVPIDL